jgi:hypothetical protein
MNIHTNSMQRDQTEEQARSRKFMAGSENKKEHIYVEECLGCRGSKGRKKKNIPVS